MHIVEQLPPLFPLGKVLATRNAIELAKELGVDFRPMIARHQRGDWGEVGIEDWSTNNEALKNGERLLSVYHPRQGGIFWIITERDRSLTTVLLPGDY